MRFNRKTNIRPRFEGDQDNQTIKELRNQLSALQTDFAKQKEAHDLIIKEKDELNTKLTDIERAKMDEVERVKAENADLLKKVDDLAKNQSGFEKIKTRNDELNTFLTSMYEERLNQIPEEQREKIKSLSFIDGNPQESITKLKDVLDILGVTIEDEALGKVTNSSDAKEKGAKEGAKPLDPKTINWSSPGVLKSVDELKAQKAAMKAARN